MKLLPLLTTTTLLLTVSPTLAALCRATGLLGLGSTSPSYPPGGKFYLRARSADNVVRTIISSPLPARQGSFSLVLGAANIQPSSPTVPKFTLNANRAVVPSIIEGGNELILATEGTGLLTPEPLFLAPSSGAGMMEARAVQVVNVTCDGIPRFVVRFTDLPLGVLGSGTTNETFAAGAGVSGPVLGGLLTLGAPIDLLILPFTS